MNIISMDLAHRIWTAHREIEVAQTLLADIEKALQSREVPTPLDAFGRRRSYQLGVPSGENSHRLFGVAPELAAAVIRAHIADQKSILEAGCLEAAQALRIAA